MLSQTTEYALRAMSCLAYEPGQLTPTPTLHKQTKVPSNYLAKVLQSLAQAHLIVGRRGVGGGYKLARPAAEISLLDVVNAIDPIQPIEDCPLGLPNHGGNLCALHRCIDQAARTLMEQFKGMTLADLVIEAQGSRPLCDADLTERLAELSFSVNDSNGAMTNGNGSHAADSPVNATPTVRGEVAGTRPDDAG